MRKRFSDTLEHMMRAIEKMPQDIRSAAGICLSAAMITIVLLSVYQQTAVGFFNQSASVIGRSAKKGGFDYLEYSDFDLTPYEIAAQIGEESEPAVFCLSFGAFIDMDEGEEYEEARSLLAQLISSEAGDQSYICQVAFGAMVVNRAKSAQFPDNLAGVIYQLGAFSSVGERKFVAVPTERAMHAARDALAGSDPGSGALYWFKSDDAQGLEQFGHRVTVTLGDFCFYK